MVRKVVMGLVMIFALLSLINISYASIDSFYTTNAYGSTAQVSEFGWNDTPWLYIKLSDSLKHLTAAWWNDPSGNSYDSTLGASSATSHWLSLTDWDSIKASGEWTIYGNVFYTGGLSETASTKFSVTPEPISASLFLLGGGALALRQYRKRTKK